MTKSNLGLNIYVILVAVLVAIATPQAQGAAPSFGPNQYSGKPNPVIQNVTVNLPQAGMYRIEIQNGKPFTAIVCSGNILTKLLCTLKNVAGLAESISSRIVSGKISINNVQVAGPADINILRTSFTKTVQLNVSNAMKLELQGLNNSRLTLAIYAELAVNQPPVARITASPVVGYAPLAVSFSGNQSSDDTGIASYLWSLGDGSNATGAQVHHTYTSPGNQVATLTVTDSMGLSNSASITISVQANTPPQASFTLTPANGFAPLLVLFDASGSNDAQGPLNPQMVWDFDDNQTLTTTAIQATHEFTNPGTYNVRLTITDQQGSSSTISHQVVVNAVMLPPSPATQAPVLPVSSVTSFSNAYDFIFSGANPIQTGVVQNSIEARRMSVLRGKILKDDNTPLEGVTVKVPLHPEWGQTISRADGQYDLAVNGGGSLVLDFSRNGYFSVQRDVTPDYESFSSVTDVVMIAPDSKATLVQINSPVSQVAESSEVTDNSGSRKATILFPANTSAEAVLPNGSRVDLKQMSVRATEFTVGSNGPKKMPSILPATSGYTYAADYSIDEARALGAKSVEFSNPIPIYVDNFLNFRVGIAIPIGVYDTEAGVWVPEANGRVIRILNESNGQAVVDIFGTGQAATSAELAALGISNDELTKLAELYDPQKTLWRATTSHFSAVDWNHPINPIAANEIRPPAKGVETVNNKKPVCPGEAVVGSKIDVDQLTLSEFIPLVGSPFQLVYSSARVPGRLAEYSTNINLAKGLNTAGIREINLTIDVAGQTFRQTFTPSQFLDTRFTWDGLDAYGRKLINPVKASATIDYLYDATYFESTNYSVPLFGRLDGFTVSSVPARDAYKLSNTYSFVLGNNLSQSNQDVGLWDLDIHHSYDPLTKTINFGSGEQRILSSQGLVIDTVAGSGLSGFSGDGGPATLARLRRPAGLTTGPDGSIYISDPADHRIRKIDPRGIISTYVGNGVAGNSGDGGPATSAQIDSPARPTLAPDGSLYFADATNHVVRRVLPNGIIVRVAGTGVAGFGGDFGQALQAQLNTPRGALISNDGSLILDDSTNHRIRRIGTDGIITTIAGTGVAGYSGDGGSALLAQLNNPFIVAMGPSGDIYIADRNNHAIRRLAPSGIITTVAGTGVGGFTGDGGPATLARLRLPNSVDIRPSGNIIIADTQNFRIREVNNEGLIETIVGTGSEGFDGDNGYATQAVFSTPTNVRVAPDGAILISDSDNFRIRRVRVLDGLQGPNTISIPSSDASEVYVFDQSGRHLSTLFAKTGAAKYEFGYDVDGRLIQVRDAYGAITSISRDSLGRAQSLTNSDGLVTQLSINSDGALASVTNPNGETHSMLYTTGGLLSDFIRPKGNVTKFSFDSLGQIIMDEDPAGGFMQFVKTFNVLTGVNLVQQTSAEGRVSSSSVTANGSTQTTIRNYPNGFQSTVFMANAGSLTLTTNLGDSEALTTAADPRFGTISEYNSAIVRRNGTLTQTIVQNRNVVLPDPSNLFNFQQTDLITTNGRTLQSIYQSSTNSTRTINPSGRQTLINYTPQELPSQLQIGNLTPHAFLYDNRGRLSEQRQGNRITSFGYSSEGFLNSITNSLGQRVTLTHDSSGRVIEEISDDGRITNYNYDLNGNLTGVQPAGRLTHAFSFNNIDRASGYNPPSVNGSTTNTIYSYNLDKQLTQVIRPDNKVINYTYGQGDLLTQLQSTSGEGATLGYTNSLLTSASSTDGISLTHVYNQKLLRAAQWQGVTSTVLNLFYNNDFLLSSYALGGISVPVIYDNDLLLVSTGGMTISRDPSTGQVLGSTLNSITDSYTNNEFGEVSSYTAQGLSLVYTRDNLGRITNKSESFQGGPVNQTEYQYDSTGRLTRVYKNGALASEYAFDSNSNRILNNGIAATFDEQDRIISYGAITYAFNLNGDLSTKTNTLTGQVTSYSFDVFGNLKSVLLPDASSVTYKVDGLNRRVARYVNGVFNKGWIYFDQLRPAAEVDASSSISAIFIYGSKSNVPEAMIKGGIRYRIISDHLGSPRLVVNSVTGAIAQALDYDDWGMVTLDSNPGFQPFGFAGGLYDASTKLVRFGARDYDSELGRWTAKDPSLFNGGQNLYVYSLNDSINLVDKDGKEARPVYEDDTPPPYNPRDATDEADAIFKNRKKDGATNESRSNNDSFRHCLASCYATSRYGDDAAEILGDLNEAIRISNPVKESCQDQANNEIGRRHGGEGVSAEQCQIRCLNSLYRGALVRGNP